MCTLRLLGLAVISTLGASCAPPTLALPAGAKCQTTVTTGPNAADVRDALTRASAGTCVVVASGKYALSYDVPAGVMFGAAPNTSVELNGTASDIAAVTLRAGAVLSGVTVKPSPNIGVALEGGGAQLLKVSIRSARTAGVVSWCEEDCRVADLSVLREVELVDNAVGLLVHGSRLTTFGGRVASSQSVSLASGYGVVASDGAHLEMNDTVVETNQELGVLIDGRSGTSATLNGVAVRDNRGRGVWAQSLAGTMTEPKLRLSNCVVEGNTLVGVGLRASRGVTMQGGRVATTKVGLAASSTPGVFVDVGDGLGLFDATGDMAIDGVGLDNNQRSQVLIDQGLSGVTLSNATLSSQGAQLGVVVQRTSATVDAPNITRPMTGQELPVSAPALAVPAR